MNVIDWLSANTPGFANLPVPDRDAMMQFSLLWGLFEDQALNHEASAGALAAFVQRCVAAGTFRPEVFAAPLAYFQQRYFHEGVPTPHLDHLHLRQGDQPGLVRAVLSGQEQNPHSHAIACLIVVYRFRNNLFHGLKWVYQLQDQLENFTHANDVLMRSLEMQAARI